MSSDICKFEMSQTQITAIDVENVLTRDKLIINAENELLRR